MRMITILKDISFDLLGFGIGAGLGLSFYAFLKTTQNIIKDIEDVSELPLNGELKKIVKSASFKGLDICLWGKVHSEDAPLHSIGQPNVVGVIWKHTIKEHIIAPCMGVWTNDEKIVDETTRSVPFCLLNDGLKVKVSNPSKLDSVDLAVISEKFVAAKNSIAEHLWGIVKGIRSTGTQYTEEMLVEGTKVLAFGKLMFENNVLHLKPHSSIPFIITTKDKQAVIEDFDSPIISLRILSVVSACVALYFSYRIGIKLHKYWKNFKKSRIESQVLEEIRQHREGLNLDIPESLMCLICCGLRDVLIMPCKHICICGDCYQKLDPKVCPVCRTEIEAIQPVFYS